ncbi:septum formation family protein [Microbacterium sp. NPDC089695]|uniref:septum formation family protein n=1 Tax=Microbacterium sp. NPDC089695 TaxID=3364198 RepID=UPI0037FBD7CA
MSIPAGWYDDGSGRRRWWDGSTWTQHTLAPAPTPQSAETTPSASAVDDGTARDAAESPTEVIPENAAANPLPHEVTTTPDAVTSAQETTASPFTPPWVHPGGTLAEQTTTPIADATAAGYVSAGVAPSAAGVAPGASPGAQPFAAGAPGAYSGVAYPGWGAPSAPAPRRGFPVLGVIALGLAVLGAVLACIPLIALAGWVALGLGFVLGVVSLFLRAPRWPGIVGMGVSVLGSFLAVAVALIAFGSIGGTSPEAGGTPVTTPTTAPPSEDDSSDFPDNAEMVAWADLEVGDCLPYIEWDEDLYEVPVVPCDQPHTDEIYLTFDVEDGDFPGDDELTLIADDRCLAEFDTFVGYAYRDSELDFYYTVPTQGTWRWGDREIICIVYSYEDVTGTLEGAGR